MRLIHTPLDLWRRARNQTTSAGRWRSRRSSRDKEGGQGESWHCYLT
jgi:hypothetical protein